MSQLTDAAQAWARHRQDELNAVADHQPAGSLAREARLESTAEPAGPTRPVRRASQHELAVMVWLAVLPTLTALQFLLGHLLAAVPLYLRPPIMATLAVPTVVYGLMPRLQRLRAHLVGRGRGIQGE
jgi:antibiotic biosynthesis monooxygenase (ABM) superfamily enzyme